MPTPVSALLHAATLVTAGIYLLLRSSPLLSYSSDALLIILLIGSLTAFVAGTTALVQNDLKRIIAWRRTPPGCTRNRQGRGVWCHVIVHPRLARWLTKLSSGGSTQLDR